ncbi:MAG: hypothetical protein ACHREM_11990 [Polyangiales bacterium]
MNEVLGNSATSSCETCPLDNSSARFVAPEPGREGSAIVVPNDWFGLAGEEDSLAAERLALPWITE